MSRDYFMRTLLDTMKNKEYISEEKYEKLMLEMRNF